jgi:hypothetical protein
MFAFEVGTNIDYLIINIKIEVSRDEDDTAKNTC